MYEKAIVLMSFGSNVQIASALQIIFYTVSFERGGNNLPDVSFILQPWFD
jgi:hypothetical protein